MTIVILGCGRLGARAAAAFLRKKYGVILVDADEEKLNQLHADPALQRVVGDVLDDAALDRAFAAPVDICLVATGKDPLNILLAQKVRVRYQTPRVLLRIFDPELAGVYRSLGLEVICPTLQALAEIEQLAARGPNPASGSPV